MERTKVLILGDAKFRARKEDVEQFQELVERIAEIEKVLYDKICQVILVHNAIPDTVDYAREKGIHLYWSYEL